MKINGNEIRQGHVLRHKNKMFIVTDANHVKPGKGGAYAQVQMRGIEDSSNITERFRSSETVERLQGSQSSCQFLYGDSQSVTLMDNETYEQNTFPMSLVGAPGRFLQDGMDVELKLYDQTPTSISLPKHATFEVIEADPVVKGQTATSSYKTALLEGDIRVLVPTFVKVGQRVIIDTTNGEYVRRSDA